MRSGERPILPIQKWHLGNFKSIERAEVDFAPLTVLVGANSSGKSSLLQSILVVSQAAGVSRGHAAVPLNGPLQNLGTFKDLRFAGAKSRGPISLGGEFVLPGSDWEMEYWPSSYKRLSDYRSAIAKRIERFSWKAEFLNSKKDALDGTLHVYRLEFSNGDGQSLVTRRVNNPPNETIEGFGPPWAVLAPGEFYARRRTVHFKTDALVHKAGIPQEVLVRRDKDALSVTRTIVGDILSRYSDEPWGEPLVPDGPFEEAVLKAIRRNERPKGEQNVKEILEKLIRGALQLKGEGPPRVSRRRFRAHMEKLVDSTLVPHLHKHEEEIYEILEEIIKEHGSGHPILCPAQTVNLYLGSGEDLDEFLLFGARRLIDFFSECVRYLGPLREQPKILYPATGAETEPEHVFVGNRGEFTYCALRDHGEDEIDCPMPPGGSDIRQSTLHEAVNVWLRELGVADRIDIDFRPTLGVQPKVKVGGVPRPLDLTALGVGASQVLPLLVMGLRSEPGTVLLIEQPELHLHPAVQQKVGDFLLACARSGKQVIVETHSDHLVSRLRRRIAEDESDEVVDYVKFVFVERVDGQSRFTQVPVNRFGGLEKWPHGFFDQTACESQELMKAGMKKRKSARASSEAEK